MDVAGFRAQFPITRSRSYLFSGALTPAAIPVRSEWEKWSAAWYEDPNAVYTPDHLIGCSDRLRAAFAQLIGAEPSSVAVTDNTSRAASIAIRLLHERPGTNVVVDDTTYPASLYPWYARGDREVRFANTDGVADAASAIAQYVDDNTVAVCISHVAPMTGRRHDLPTISAVAHSHGATLIVDAAQSAGVVPIDVVRDGVDVLITTTMKWLLGSPGVAMLYLAPELLADAPLLDVSYAGLEDPFGDWPSDRMPPSTPGARRYELGLPNLAGVHAAKAGIELLLEVGVENIFPHVERMMNRCLDGLAEQGAEVRTPTAPGQRAGVIVVEHAEAHGVYDACRDAGVDIGVIGPLRIDPHGFNDETDIDRFLECFRQYNAAR